MSHYLSHLARLTLNQVESLQPRLASRFETPVDEKVSDNDDIAMIEESPFSSFAHSQSSAATDNPSPVTQKVMTEFNDGQIKKEPNQQNPFKFIEHTESEPVIKQADMPKHEQKSSIGQSFSPIDTEPVRKVAPSIIQPVLQPSYAVSSQDSLPKENTHTIIERVHENFTEITHNELVIREIAEQAHSHQKSGIFEESINYSEPFADRVMTEQIPFQSNHKAYSLEEQPRSIPVKPNNIVVRTEQSIVASNTPSQFGVQQTPVAQFGIDTTPAPTIQVTIGRIEIRATQVSDKSSAKPRPASATMSLDDYLKQRKEGRS
jgi:hypothetical protein